jgi:hypothetical protein
LLIWQLQLDSAQPATTCAGITDWATLIKGAASSCSWARSLKVWFMIRSRMLLFPSL